MIIIKDIEKFASNIESEILFDFEIKNLNWFNIGGKTKVFFKPKTLKDLVEFLKLYSRRSKIFILGSGSNVLISDEIFQGLIIKLGKDFSRISLLNENTIVAGAATTQRRLSEFSKDNNIGGLEFMSCIPGSIGGGVRMNSGCFNKEFKDVLVSIQVIDFNGQVKSIPAEKINFKYRNTDLPDDIIFLSATFKGYKKNNLEIEKYMKELKEKKEISQPTKLKTSGSTFKNPISQTQRKVWELIKESVPLDKSFGDAHISDKHCNFFVNKGNASFKDMNKLINFVTESVLKKTGINLEKEIKILK